MSQHSFRLGPKELYLCAPDTPTEAQATRIVTQIDGRERIFLARVVPSFHHNRTPERFKFWSFYWLEDTEADRIFGNTITVVDTPTNPWSAEKSAAYLQKDFPSYLHRFWQLQEQLFCLAFASFGSGEIIRRGHNRFDEAFRWQGKTELNSFLDWPQSKFLSFCEDLSADKKSDLGFLLQWSQFSEAEKNEVAFGCKRGAWLEMCRLLMLVLRVASGSHGTFPNEKKNHSHWDFVRPIAPEDTPTTRFLTRWSELIFDEFQPEFWRGKHLCVHRWRQEGQRAKNLGLSNAVSCDVPSAHELVEAMVELRKWSKGKISDADISDFFPHVSA